MFLFVSLVSLGVNQAVSIGLNSSMKFEKRVFFALMMTVSLLGYLNEKCNRQELSCMLGLEDLMQRWG